ncbi:MAG: N-6 DNA methylase [Anaerolineae bacterium]|jgi:type I restriction enzyme M protein|nr:N-6 DNA methylase [Anaerolineae bacterium]
MLDTDTKRRIDTARDILVGKVPDPKSQVEQITIALIYKFMDDMDLESEELGGARTFFAGDFARYGWAKLMRSGLGGHETLNLYAEAIARMPENPGIPPLFRDIFKNAYLPYRDPETLRAFLKIIDEFEYDHSERLGDAFEYLLSVLGSQGDAGQFRTPRHIIDFIVAIVDPQKHETVMDPACGTAGFLISSYKHILAANTIHMDSQDRQDKGRNASSASPSISSSSSSPSASSPSCSSCPSMSISTLTPDDRARLAANFRGYDISPDMVRLSLVNLYLHGFADPHIYEYDTLTSLERWNETADVILANPPFMSPKGGIRPHNRFSVQSKRSEVLFVDYIAEHLTPAGRAGIIVPEGIIFQSQNAYKNLRKMLVEQALVAVISLPAGVFNPYSGVKTSILILDRALARRLDSVAFFKVENDGFNLGAQRRPIEQNDLPEVQALAREWMNHGIHGTHGSWEEDPRVLVVPRARIAANGDYNLSGERYRENGSRSSEYPYVTLGEICSINPEVLNPAQFPQDSFINYIDISCVENETGKLLGANTIMASEAPSRARRAIRKDDVLISTVRPNLKAFTIIKEVPERAIASTGFAVLRARVEHLVPDFLLYMLRNRKTVDQMIGMMGKGAYPSINQSDVESVCIPLPPLEVQREIVAEIEGYQRVIDGARAVLDHYRPHIPIDPEWEMVAIGDLCIVERGASPRPIHAFVTDASDGVNWIKIGDAEVGTKYISQTKERITQEGAARSRHVKPGDFILSNSMSFGRPYIMAIEGCIHDGWLLLRDMVDTLDQDFLYNILGSDIVLQQFQRAATGGVVNNLNSELVRKVTIPLPPLETQRAIVAEIEAEQALVDANRELIARFERKIQATLARVWGEESDG